MTPENSNMRWYGWVARVFAVLDRGFEYTVNICPPRLARGQKKPTGWAESKPKLKSSENFEFRPFSHSGLISIIMSVQSMHFQKNNTPSREGAAKRHERTGTMFCQFQTANHRHSHSTSHPLRSWVCHVPVAKVSSFSCCCTCECEFCTEVNVCRGFASREFPRFQVLWL